MFYGDNRNGIDRVVMGVDRVVMGGVIALMGAVVGGVIALMVRIDRVVVSANWVRSFISGWSVFCVCLEDWYGLPHIR